LIAPQRSWHPRDRTAAAQAAGRSLQDTVAIRAGQAGTSPRLAPLLAVAGEIASNVGKRPGRDLEGGA